jgi:hypothetical protein
MTENISGLIQTGADLKAGIYADMPDEDYRRIPARSSTRLHAVYKNALKAEYDRLNPKPKSHYTVGNAVHRGVLQPHLLSKEVIMYEGRRVRGTKNPSKWDKFREAHRDKLILTPAEFREVKGMVEAVYAHELAADLLTEEGYSEVTIIWWTHYMNGGEGPGNVKCKSRLDRLTSKTPLLLDLKTTKSVEKQFFERDSAEMGYDLKMAFYHDAAASLGLKDIQVKLIAVEKKPPHDVAVYSMSEEILNIGRRKYWNAIGKIYACEKSGLWPGYAPSEELNLELPYWAKEEEF